MTAKFWGQHEIRANYQAIFWYIFSIENANDTAIDLLNEFLHSEILWECCLPFIVKKNIDHKWRFLPRAFNLRVLNLSNFKALSREQVLDFLDDYSDSPSWREDRDDFLTILNRFSELFQKEATGKFFLISKEWFKKEDEILNPNGEPFIYYFILIWFNANKKEVNVCEWAYD